MIKKRKGMGGRMARPTALCGSAAYATAPDTISPTERRRRCPIPDYHLIVDFPFFCVKGNVTHAEKEQ
jgi:hypothetical protein